MEENSSYLNQENLSGESLATVPKHHLFVSDTNYAFDITELIQYFELTTNGILKNPYLGTLFSSEDQNKLKEFPGWGERISQINQIDVHLNQTPIARKTIIELLWLALALSVDYPARYQNPSDRAHTVSMLLGQTHHKEISLFSRQGVAAEYVLSNHAVSLFAQYLEEIPTAERERLQNTIIEWKVDHNPQRVKFKDKFESLVRGEECVHKAAVFFWACARALNPELGSSIPEPINFTNNYWDRMIQVNSGIVVEDIGAFIGLLCSMN